MHRLCRLRMIIFAAFSLLIAGRVSATTVIPIADSELYARADVIVHGIVVSSEVREDAAGRPVTVTVISPLEVVKGRLTGDLILWQLGGEFLDGRFLKIWGRPEYAPGYEVLVFAIERDAGDYQTAELFLGKFEIRTDEAGTSFAVRPLAATSPGIQVLSAETTGQGGAAGMSDMAAPRELSEFLRFLRQPDDLTLTVSQAPLGDLSAVIHPEYIDDRPRPAFGSTAGALWRWNNGATATWTLEGTAKITGGGINEATRAAATWNNEPNSTIAYTVGAGSDNVIHLNALSSICGWSTCLSGGGIIGCGGSGGLQTNLWRDETYSTITGGEVWLRSYCTTNAFDSITTQGVLTHELGHTLGLGHSDQEVSRHDLCRGDESAAIMNA